MDNIKKILCILFFALLCMVKSNVMADTSFSKKQIEQIVHDYLINNPTLLIEVGKKLQEQEISKDQARIQKIRNNIPKYKKEIFDTKSAGRAISGNLNGKIIITEFTQYQCPHCKNVAPIIIGC